MNHLPTPLDRGAEAWRHGFGAAGWGVGVALAAGPAQTLPKGQTTKGGLFTRETAFGGMSGVSRVGLTI